MATTGGERHPRNWLALGALTLGAFAFPWGCENFGGKPDEAGAGALPDEVQAALSGLLEDAWPEVIGPTLDRCQVAADGLIAASEGWLSALESGGDAATARTAAQDEWLDLMASWQEAEVMQLGPAAFSLASVGGEDLRDEVYSWTTVNPCRVDQETAEEGWTASDFTTANLVNVYGLDALETLLFSAPDDNACPPQVPPNSDGRWDALGEDGISALRAAYAIALAAHVSARIGEIRDGWDPDDGNFAGKLANAGSTGSPFDTQEAGLNAIFDGLFYLETQTKDRKLAWPLGKQDCGHDDCTSEVESPAAGASHLWIRANLTGFRALFTGGGQMGMDDLLVSLGHADLTEEMVSALDEADAAAADLTLPLEVAVSEDPAAAEGLFDATQVVTQLLKRDIATVLNLQIPQEAAGDND